MEGAAGAVGVPVSAILMIRATEKLCPDLLHTYAEPTDPQLQAALLAAVRERVDIFREAVA